MTAGPIRRPTALTEALGNPGHRAKSREPRPPALLDLAPPDYLDDVARDEWLKVSGQLHSLNLLTELDASALAMYCMAWSDFIRLTEFLNQNGSTIQTKNGFVAPRPEVAMRRNAFMQVQRMCQEFGFTPGSRARMQVSLEPKKALSLEEILNGDSIN